jgi:CheY-like chemotaxis protein/chemotaxis protein histidine kinase CheA
LGRVVKVCVNAVVDFVNSSSAFGYINKSLSLRSQTMVMIPEGRAQTYYEFEQQAKMLLSEIEQALAVLPEDRSLKHIYQLMRATYTLRVDAASLDLELVSELASGVENICRLLAAQTINFESRHWELLQSAHKYLQRLLLNDPQTIPQTELTIKAEVKVLIARLQAEIAAFPSLPSILPTAAELGIDLDNLMLAEEIPQLLQEWEKIVAQKETIQTREKLADRAEICLRFGELLNLPQFVSIARIVLTVLDNQPSLTMAVGSLALMGLKTAYQAARDKDRIPDSEVDPDSLAIESLFQSQKFTDIPLNPTAQSSSALDSMALNFIAHKDRDNLPPSLAIEDLIQDYLPDEEFALDLDDSLADIWADSAVEGSQQLNSTSQVTWNQKDSVSPAFMGEVDFAEPYFIDTENLLVWQVGHLALTLPSSRILEISASSQAYRASDGTYPTNLTWNHREIPLFHLEELLRYNCYVPQALPSLNGNREAAERSQAAFLIVVQLEKEIVAIDLVIDELISQSYLEILPFSLPLQPPKSIYGCTLLRDEKLLAVVDAIELLQQQIPSQTYGLRETILIVDDSKTVREILRLTLQSAGYQVLTAEDGEQAIQCCQQYPEIKLIICDIEMPKVNGFEFLIYRRQQAEWGKTPVVMLTFCSTEKEKNLASQLGAVAYITKPYLREDLLAIIEGILTLNPV